MTLGAFEVTALSDGTADLPFTQLLNAPKANIEKALTKSFLKDPVESSFNGFLINTGSKLVLIDTGAGKLFGPTLGRLVANLQAAGYQPEQVDEIYITHMHPDHVGGLASDGNAYTRMPSFASINTTPTSGSAQPTSRPHRKMIKASSKAQWPR